MASRQRVERRYPEQDWRGIAMLAEQLTGLFQPSKAKLQSRSQEHEMRLLEAKQSWEFGKERLKSEKAQLVKAREDLETEQGKLEAYGADVMDVSLKEFTLPDEASTIFQDNDVRKLSDLNDLANQYHEQLMATKKQLDQFEDMNTHAIFGEEFGNSYKGKKGAKDYRKEFDIEPATPGLLSIDERENIKYAILKDTYHVPDEELETAEHITLTAAGKEINVRPEAIAFSAGYDKSGEFSMEERAIKTVKAKTATAKQSSVDEFLNLDAEWMKLSKEDQDIIINYAGATAEIKSTVPLPVDLLDSYEQFKAKIGLADDIGKLGQGDRIQPLSDDIFASEWKDLSWAPTGKTEVFKPWVEAGLSQEMYNKIREMGSKSLSDGTKSGDIRAALEYTIRNWDTLSDVAKEVSITKIKAGYAALIKRGV